MTALASLFEYLVLSESVNLAKILSTESPTTKQGKVLFQFVLFFIMANVLRLALLYFQTFTSQKIGAEIAKRIFSNLINARTADIAGGNESEFTAALISKVNLFVSRVVLSYVTLISSVLLFITISMSIYIVVGVSFIMLIAVVCLFYFTLFFLLKKRIEKISNITSLNQTATSQLINQVFQSFQMMKILQLEKTFLNIFSKFDYPFRIAQAQLQFASGAPRFLIEIIGITVFAFLLVNMSDVGLQLTSIGALAIGIQRLMPLIQLMYANYSNISASHKISLDIQHLILSAKEKYQPDSVFKFDSANKIKLQEISYKFPEADRNVIDKLNLKLPLGKMILITGPSGCGKSTLVDLLIGLREPSAGYITYPDSAKTQMTTSTYFGLTPQKTPIIAGTILENISLGKQLTRSDLGKIDYFLSRLNLKRLIQQLPSGMHTVLSPHGGILSGGERQRLGLVRALYRQPKLLILDEITSALDTLSEKNVMEILSEQCLNGATVIVISHSTIINDYFDIMIRYDEELGFHIA